MWVCECSCLSCLPTHIPTYSRTHLLSSLIVFQNRRDAGQRLAARLSHFSGRSDLVVLGIPRGGIVVAAEVARALRAPLDVFMTRKLGAPFNPELAIGAIAGDGTVILDNQLIYELQIPKQTIQQEMERQMCELARRIKLYRQGRPGVELRDKTVILCDDGIATGSTTRAALRALASHEPARRVLAVPIAPRITAKTLARECDEVVLIDTPEPFAAVGYFYEDFEQVSDDEVVAILAEFQYQ